MRKNRPNARSCLYRHFFGVWWQRLLLHRKNQAPVIVTVSICIDTPEKSKAISMVENQAIRFFSDTKCLFHAMVKTNKSIGRNIIE